MEESGRQGILMSSRAGNTVSLPDRGEELLDLIQKPTAKEAATVKRFKTEGGPAVREYCPNLTKVDCCRWDSIVICVQCCREA